jgi:hypothetical protein
MSPNLLPFLDRVQQLLVRVLFPLGISDSDNPISHVTFSLSKSLLGCRSGIAAEPSQAARDSLICIIARHLDADLRAK